jgi:hypothetical protein
MTITKNHKEASQIEVGNVISTAEGIGIVVDIMTDEVDHYLGSYGIVRFEVEYTDGTVEYAVYQDDLPVELASVTLEQVDAIITAHNTTCPEGNPDACEQCDALWSARADANA